MAKTKKYNEHAGFPSTTDETPTEYEAVAVIEDAPSPSNDTIRLYLITDHSQYIDVRDDLVHIIPASKFTPYQN